jgi:(p)ppGpp synthase/HD superfamily hydrolase
MMSLSYEAMIFAREAHKDQVRKYTGNPYADHLAEVAGIVATVAEQAHGSASIEDMIATAWLHDCVEDQGVTLEEIAARFGNMVAIGVSGLSDIEVGNRATRKRMSCERLASCSGWIQTIKCADLISNTSSIVKHDPAFATVYLREKRELLAAMTKADRRLWNIAVSQAKGQA